MRYIIIFLLLTSAGISCSNNENLPKKEAVDSYVDFFYSNVNNENYDAIYSKSSGIFKNEISYENFHKFMSDNNTLRGAVLDYEFMGIVYKVKKSEDLYVSSALFAVTYEKQMTEETFTFLNEKEPKLAYYYIKPVSQIKENNFGLLP